MHFFLLVLHDLLIHHCYYQFRRRTVLSTARHNAANIQYKFSANIRYCHIIIIE